MESLQQQESTMQIQDKPQQESQQIPPSSKQEKSHFDDSESDDHHQQQQQQHQQQRQKRVDESKDEDEMKGLKAEGSSDHKHNMDEKGVPGPRERLKRHRREVAGQVWIPDMWGQEDFLKDWIDCSAFDASLTPQGIILARASLMEEGRRRSNSNSLRLETSSC